MLSPFLVSAVVTAMALGFTRYGALSVWVTVLALALKVMALAVIALSLYALALHLKGRPRDIVIA